MEADLAEKNLKQQVPEIDETVFNHLVELAALELDQTEAAYLREELNGQLSAIHELQAIEVAADVPITSHGVPYAAAMRLPLREDDVKPFAQVEEILEQAPKSEARYLIVPDIPHEDLE
jgi:aspartyl/glutamyl-tRNA(Asn/Gln) amidotransferase C subunit